VDKINTLECELEAAKRQLIEAWEDLATEQARLNYLLSHGGRIPFMGEYDYRKAIDKAIALTERGTSEENVIAKAEGR
jgi:hypothetical protein